MSVMGTRVLRKEDPEFLTSGAVYTADLKDPRLNGACYVAFVRSTIARAKILSIDTSEAESLDGVLKVYTANDIKNLGPVTGPVPMFPEPMMNRPILAAEECHFYAEPIAVVAAETSAIAADAVELVVVDYEPLTPVVDLEEAASDKEIIYEEVGTNVAMDFSLMGMVTGINAEEDIFADCEAVVSKKIINHRVAPAPLEGRSAACIWEGEKLVFWNSNQAPHGAMGALMGAYGLEPGGVQVIGPAAGGGFGQKISPSPEELILPYIARELSRPVRWTETRSENLMAAGHGRAQLQTITMGGSKDGKVSAYRLEILADAGAYTNMGAFLPFFTHVMASGTYDIAKIETTAKSVVTNTAPTVAYRGAGRPEATAAIERAMDIFAAEIDMDPAELRRKNLISADKFPFTTPTGAEYDTGEYEKALDIVLKAGNYEQLRAEQKKRLESGDRMWMGLGVAVYVEITAGPAPGGNEFAKVQITPEGKATVYSGAFSHGQSHLTTFAMLAADQLGLDIEDVEVVQGDTDQIQQGVGTFGSRSLQIGGSAVFDASGKLAEKAKELAANMLEAKPEDMVIEEGKFFVAGTPAVSVSWVQVAEQADSELVEESDFNANCSFPFGVHLAVVEVDSQTGHTRLARLITCDDSGVLLNPMIVEGQRHGGNAQGAAQALMEEIRYDADGTLSTSNFADYEFISAMEVPSFELETIETPTQNNPLGAKGIGESGAIGSTPAVQSAVADALKHLGVRHIDIPCTPERVWQTIKSIS